jgi:hypothetical protein
MKKVLRFTTIIVILAVFSSCSSKLTGTWKIASYEEGVVGEPSVTMTNIGSITFEKNGSGTKAFTFSLMGAAMEDNEPFTWKQAGISVLIEGGESELSKAWVISSKKKGSQTWHSTENNKVQTLILIK